MIATPTFTGWRRNVSRAGSIATSSGIEDVHGPFRRRPSSSSEAGLLGAEGGGGVDARGPAGGEAASDGGGAGEDERGPDEDERVVDVHAGESVCEDLREAERAEDAERRSEEREPEPRREDDARHVADARAEGEADRELARPLRHCPRDDSVDAE